MNQQQHRQQLTDEVARRRERLETARRNLQLATERFKISGDAAQGQSVTQFAEAARLAEIALDGAHEQLQRLDQAQRVVTDPVVRCDLARDRAEIVRRRDYRHKEHQERVDRIRQRCAGMSEAHTKIVINNECGNTEYLRRKEDERDAEALARIDAQLGDASSGGPQEAA